MAVAGGSGANRGNQSNGQRNGGGAFVRAFHFVSYPLIFLGVKVDRDVLCGRHGVQREGEGAPLLGSDTPARAPSPAELRCAYAQLLSLALTCALILLDAAQFWACETPARSVFNRIATYVAIGHALLIILWARFVYFPRRTRMLVMIQPGMRRPHGNSCLARFVARGSPIMELTVCLLCLCCWFGNVAVAARLDAPRAPTTTCSNTELAGATLGSVLEIFPTLAIHVHVCRKLHNIAVALRNEAISLRMATFQDLRKAFSPALGPTADNPVLADYRERGAAASKLVSFIAVTSSLASALVALCIAGDVAANGTDWYKYAFAFPTTLFGVMIVYRATNIASAGQEVTSSLILNSITCNLTSDAAGAPAAEHAGREVDATGQARRALAAALAQGQQSYQFAFYVFGVPFTWPFIVTTISAVSPILAWLIGDIHNELAH